MFLFLFGCKGTLNDQIKQAFVFFSPMVDESGRAVFAN